MDSGASHEATRAKTREKTSFSMCQASVWRARLLVRIPPTNSIMKMERVMAKAIPRALRPFSDGDVHALDIPSHNLDFLPFTIKTKYLPLNS